MRLGFVGVGKHARRLAQAFSECDADIVAYDRGTLPGASSGEPEGFGRRMAWPLMITSNGIDAIVCCAPPAITRRVADASFEAERRVMLTKPVDLAWDLEKQYGYDAGFFSVDLWRLYSPAWLALKADLQGKEIRSVHVDFCGNGPVRSTHSGLLDYGPHALAFVLDLGLRPELTWDSQWQKNKHPPGQAMWTAKGFAARSEFGSPCVIGINTGNGFGSPMMYVRVDHSGGSSVWCEAPDGIQSYLFRKPDGVCGSSNPMLQCDRSLAIRNFCRAFLAGEPSNTLRISCEAMRLLRQAEPEPARPAAP